MKIPSSSVLGVLIASIAGKDTENPVTLTLDADAAASHRDFRRDVLQKAPISEKKIGERERDGLMLLLRLSEQAQAIETREGFVDDASWDAKMASFGDDETARQAYVDATWAPLFDTLRAHGTREEIWNDLAAAHSWWHWIERRVIDASTEMLPSPAFDEVHRAAEKAAATQAAERDLVAEMARTPAPAAGRAEGDILPA